MENNLQDKPAIKKILSHIKKVDQAIEEWVQHFINEIDRENQKE